MHLCVLLLLLLSVRGVAELSLGLQDVAHLFDLDKSSKRVRNSPQIGPELLSASSQRIPHQMGSSMHITQPDVLQLFFPRTWGRDNARPHGPCLSPLLRASWGDRWSRWPLFAIRAAGSLFKEPPCLRKRGAVSPSPLTSELSFHSLCSALPEIFFLNGAGLEKPLKPNSDISWPTALVVREKSPLEEGPFCLLSEESWFCTGRPYQLERFCLGLMICVLKCCNQQH